MTQQTVYEARSLVLDALAKLDLPDAEAVHPGVGPHLRGARAQLDAVCALLTFSGPDTPA